MNIRFQSFRHRLAGGVLALLGALQALPSLAALPVQHWTAASGARVYFVESRDLPILDLSVDFPAGSSADTREKSGVANLTRHLLTLGAGGLTEDAISRGVADVGAALGGRLDQDRAGLSLRTLSSAREREQALDIFSKSLQQPEFPEKILEREKARIVASIKESDTKPDTIADRNFTRALYGDHPYALRTSGELGTVPGIGRDDLVRFHGARYTSSNAVVAIMGDVSRAEAEAIAERVTGGLPKGQPSPEIPPVPMPDRAKTERIAHPASQSHIVLGFPGMTRDDPDYFPLLVGNYTLGGGGFSSRLVEEVRAKRGYAYSAHSYFLPLLRKGPFEVGLQTKKEQADQALAVVRDTLREFIAKGPTRKELDDAKQNLVGGFPLRLDSNRKIHEYLGLIGFYRLPLTWLDDYTKRVEAVSVEQIRGAFQRRIDLDRLVTVVVGAPEAK